MQKLEAANIAANSSLIALLMSILQPDIIVAGLCGGVVSILTIEELTIRQRFTSIGSSILTSAFVGPWVAGVLPPMLGYVMPTSLVNMMALGGQETRMLIGFTIGFTAYKFLPALLSRGLHEIKNRRAP